MGGDKEGMEQIHIISNGDSDPKMGTPLYLHQDYTVSHSFAKIRYERGTAVPSARFYLEKLKGLGVVGVKIDADPEPNLAPSAEELELTIIRE